MIFGSSKRKKEQETLQAILQAEDDAFHRTIVALERLETHLLPDGQDFSNIRQTAVGTSRDLHDYSMPVADDIMYYLELQLDCKALYMCAHYDNPEMFKVAVESFMKDLLEWYGGRSLLPFYDAVDSAIIPLMVALSYKSDEIDELFEKYVNKTPSISQFSTEDKYQAVNEGMNAFIKGQHKYEEERKNSAPDADSELITAHYRGSALDGYKRIIAALSYLCDTSAPLKLFVKMAKQYLPDVAAQMPAINEEAIDRMYDLRNNPRPAATKAAVKEATADPFEIEFEWENNLNPSAPEAIKPSERIEEREARGERERREEREAKYARIRALANEIIELVKSLEEEK